MDPFSVEEARAASGARIVAVGVGGGGGNMIGHMIREGVSGIEMIVVNTDAQVLEESGAARKIQIGTKLTKGLGAGMKPEVGKESALENYDEIRSALQGADIVLSQQVLVVVLVQVQLLLSLRSQKRLVLLLSLLLQNLLLLKAKNVLNLQKSVLMNLNKKVIVLLLSLTTNFYLSSTKSLE